MQTNLAEKSCTPCRGGVPPLTPEEAEAIAGRPRSGASSMTRRGSSGPIASAISATRSGLSNRPRALAEAEGHHPDISFGWGYATVSLRTKKIKGLHENDFIMAAKLDRIAGAPATAG